MTDPDDLWEDYESGPFCRHWNDPAFCDATCDLCSHECCEHDNYWSSGECYVDGCKCDGWADE